MRCPKIPGVAEIDLPWEKIKRVGAEAVRDEELLAVIFRTGYGNSNVLELSTRILKKHPLANLTGMALQEMSRIKGINTAKATLLIAAFELSRRALNQGMGILPSISRPADILPIISDIKDEKKEHFVVVFLNARNQVICRETVSVGSLNASLVHPREVFTPAVGSSAASLILCHNHPSSDVTPSREDIELTRRIAQAGEIMGIEVLDHLVVASERFLSMKEANLF